MFLVGCSSAPTQQSLGFEYERNIVDGLHILEAINEPAGYGVIAGHIPDDSLFKLGNNYLTSIRKINGKSVFDFYYGPVKAAILPAGPLTIIAQCSWYNRSVFGKSWLSSSEQELHINLKKDHLYVLSSRHEKTGILFGFLGACQVFIEEIGIAANLRKDMPTLTSIIRN